MRKPKLLILKTGTTAPEVVRLHGDYDRWFIGAMGDPERFSVAEIFRGEPLPDPTPFDGIIVTGSPLSVCAPEPWMRPAGATLREWAEAGRAILGVCFGHQLLGDAFGVSVIRNPSGREIGTVRIEVTEEDPLFEGLPSSFEIQTTHTDIVSAVPLGTRLLAQNAQTGIQALRFGKRARGVQFHPELSAETMRTMIQVRAPALTAEGITPVVRETSAGVEILRRFEERIV